jgi:hypothetical protein
MPKYKSNAIPVPDGPPVLVVVEKPITDRRGQVIIIAV